MAQIVSLPTKSPEPPRPGPQFHDGATVWLKSDKTKANKMTIKEGGIYYNQDVKKWLITCRWFNGDDDIIEEDFGPSELKTEPAPKGPVIFVFKPDF